MNNLKFLMDLLNQIETIKTLALEAFTAAETLDEVLVAQKRFLGKKSDFSAISKQLKTLSPEEKKTIGKAVSETRKEIESAFEKRKKVLEVSHLNESLAAEWIDVSRPVETKTGTIHPLSQVQRDVERIFTSMGFMIADGPQIETEWHNFDALNIPGHHPARDMQDTFWIKKDSEDSSQNYVLRTQTSNVQIRTMREHGAPIRLIAPGRVFRNEDVDATHDAVFYQVEGLLVDEGISLAHLKGTIKTMLSELFGYEVKVRFRPGYFPFVEPGLEVDMWFEYTDKNGEKQGKWLEFMGAGMVHPNVLRNCDIDPEKYSGFAFGFGLTRLAMMRYKINDIRLLLSQKVDFLRQF